MGTATKSRGRYNVALIQDDMALKGWLPSDLARESGLSPMTISRFLSGEARTAPAAKKIAKALGRAVRRYYIPLSDEAVAS
jgi:transcriptional regulator with XRE-family HTH domain